MSLVSVPSECPPQRVGCAHCGLPAPLPDSAEQPSFCCRGCQGAYELIRGWGLGEYYELREPPDGDQQISDAESESFADFDEPSLLGRSAPMRVESAPGDQLGAIQGKLLKSRLAISGLHCVACIWLLERACEQVGGWHSSKVNMHERTIDVVYDPTEIPLSKVAEFIYRLGYSVAIVKDEPDPERRLDEGQRLLVDIAIAGFCTANAMWIAIALYAGEFTGIAAGHATFLRAAGVVLGAMAVAFPGRLFFRSAWASWRARTPHMDLPVAVGLSAGLAGSIYGLVDVTRDVYFDSIACLVFFLLVGRWLQMRQQRRAGDAVADLIQMSPTAASRLDAAGNVSRVPVESLTVGDQIRINPAESIPVDGVVVAGRSSVDRSLLTGESRPVEVHEGSTVEAGTENLRGVLRVRATAAAIDSRFASLTRAVSDAAQSRTPVVQLANRIGGWFVITVLILAAMTAMIWTWRDPSRAVANSVALLIVACPCALALATPLAIAIAIGRLARQRILIRDGDALERIARPGTILFDKTGTLTEGRMRVVHWRGSEFALRAAAAIEATVSHPIAHAFCQFAADGSDGKPSESESLSDVRNEPGRGVSAIFDAKKITVGSVRAAQDSGIILDESWNSQADLIHRQAASPVVVWTDDAILAMFGVADPIREEAAEVVEHFKSRGWQIGILSGDNQATVDRVSAALGIPQDLAIGDLLPEQKLSSVQSDGNRHPVVMVGDGVNDAASLAAADVGIAIQGGAAASLQAAPVMVGDGQLARVVMLVEAARSTRASVYRNFAVSIGYNLFAVSLAMTGTITPLLAALLMPASSISILALTLSGRTIAEREP